MIHHMHFSHELLQIQQFLTTIFTTPVRLMTRTVSKKVRRFLWAGRVVMKKLERARWQKLEMVKERRERRDPTVPITSSPLILSYLILNLSCF